ncbi:MAG TPA: FkbM family methyltransferase [Cyclobacteriaceae bacterium]|nr:FkbM family methyltransferase [Cyclobacteriaceae bacterium]
MLIRKLKIAFYFLWDLLTLGRGVSRVINGFEVRFPPRWSRYFQSDYEHENVTFMKEHCISGTTIIDIGAHMGLMSVIAARLTGKEGRVIAFEPAPFTYRILRRMLTINHMEDRIEAVSAAVSDWVGETQFLIDENEGSNANSLVHRNDKQRTATKVPVTTLDHYVFQNRIDRIHFIKIDAEGVELSVLSGAQQIIRRDRPVILLSIHPALIKNNNQEIRDIYSKLMAWGYPPSIHGKPMTENEFCEQPDFFDLHLVPA